MSAQVLALAILATLAVLYTLSAAAGIIIPLVLAIVLKLMLQPAMRLLTERAGLPLGMSALLLIVALFGLVGAVGLAVAVPASGWLAKAPAALNLLEEQLSLLRAPLAAISHAMQQAAHLAEPAGGAAAAPAAASPVSLGGVGLSLLLGTQDVLGRLLVLVVTLFFLLAAGDSMLRKTVEVTPRFKDKKHVVYIVSEVERHVSGYLATITLVNIAVGAATGLAAYACGMSDPLLWATAVFLLNFIPIVGPIFGILVLFLAGLLTFGHVWPALLPAGLYLAVHLVEGQMVTPLLLARRFTLSPLMVILSLFFWHWLWGIPGALLSVPLLATLKIICDRIPALAALGHLLGPGNERQGVA
jgi:predicted PurR-regulated permease PerM